MHGDALAELKGFGFNTRSANALLGQMSTTSRPQNADTAQWLAACLNSLGSSWGGLRRALRYVPNVGPKTVDDIMRVLATLGITEATCAAQLRRVQREQRRRQLDEEARKLGGVIDWKE